MTEGAAHLHLRSRNNERTMRKHHWWSVCAVRGTPCWHTSGVLSEEPKAEQSQLGVPKDTSADQSFPRFKHSELHLGVQVIPQRCQALTLVNLQPVTAPQHPSPPAFQREMCELLLCRRRCYQRHWQWGEPHDPVDARINLVLYHR